MTSRYHDYSVMDLLVVGARMVGGFDEEAAVKMYLRLHPQADEAEVRAELSRELAKDGEVWPAPPAETK